MDQALPVRRIDVNARDIYRRTPLHVAAFLGGTRRLNAAGALRKHGTDIKAEDKQGKTPFQLASLSGHDEIMELLLEYGAKH